MLDDVEPSDHGVVGAAHDRPDPSLALAAGGGLVEVAGGRIPIELTKSLTFAEKGVPGA